VRRLVLCILSAAALVACGNPAVESDVPAAAPVATSPSSTTSAAQVAVPDSLAFTAPQVGGGTIDLAQYAGQPVLLWFWAPT
jgi:hypothetical protein